MQDMNKYIEVNENPNRKYANRISVNGKSEPMNEQYFHYGSIIFHEFRACQQLYSTHLLSIPYKNDCPTGLEGDNISSNDRQVMKVIAVMLMKM